MSCNELEKIKEAVKTQVSKTDEVIASNEAIADVISGLDNTLSEVQGTFKFRFFYARRWIAGIIL